MIGKEKKGKKDAIEIIHSAVSNKIWRLLRTNSSAVHLHVLVLKDVENGLKSGNFISFYFVFKLNIYRIEVLRCDIICDHLKKLKLAIRHRYHLF